MLTRAEIDEHNRIEDRKRKDQAMTVTPRPWKIDKYGLLDIRVAGFSLPFDGEPDAIANRDFIVRAVNTFDEAKAALEAINQCYRNDAGVLFIQPDSNAAKGLKAVLARMEEK